MLNVPQTEKFLLKYHRFCNALEPMIFNKIGELQNTQMLHTDDRYYTVPTEGFVKADKGAKWSGAGTYCWFKGDYTVPAEYAGKTLFIMPHISGYEALLFVNGKPFGNFATKIVVTGHGNHYCDMIKYDPKAGEKLDIAIEYYAGHYVPSNHPGEKEQLKNFDFEFNGADICVKNYEIQEFYFDLRTVLQLIDILPANSFRRADLINAAYEAYKICPIAIEDVSFDELLEAISRAKPILKAELAKKNSESAPTAAVIGHSHMDTAWLWHVGETVKKCARTYANALTLMEEYPEYKFFQSSACHGNMMLRYYPELFSRIQKAVKEKKYEPNGGVWVECDCNITSGESMVRQFLWGQRFTRKYFDYTSNCFWLPDTFGYSAAIPQIMKGCDVDYFLTTKIAWNDTNEFPYDTFYWEGIDGTRVFSHFNTINEHPDIEHVSKFTNEDIKQRGVTKKRLLAYGRGDGGGGPEFEMLEEARRINDLEGCPKVDYVLVGEFMQQLEKEVKSPNTYKGELYLERHRGTLTNQHTIKRNNRKSEFALRDLEIFTVDNAVKAGIPASSERIAPLYEVLLINQFHDILPGTCINRAHVESRAQTSKLIKDAVSMVHAFADKSDKNKISLVNTLSFARNDVLFLDIPEGYMIDSDYAQQRYTDLDGNSRLMVSGITIPAFSTVTLTLKEGEPVGAEAFVRDGDVLDTPYAHVTFAQNGTIKSFIDKRMHRELVNGENFNTFMMAEDYPEVYDNWDVDADIEDKYKAVSELLASEVISVGAVAYVVRNKYKISGKSGIVQDMIFFNDSPSVRFDTAIDWQDDHRFLKAAFDTDIREDFARHEIQFGYIKRPTTRNNNIEQAKFETVNHKYTDISETRCGVAVLNDCKYAVSTNGGSIRLSLHKGGTHPDHLGDHDGIHRCVYEFLPHNIGFSADSVIKPSYMLNVPAVQVSGEFEMTKLANVSADNVIVEAVKPCEDEENAYIVRLYEAEGAYTECGFEAAGKRIVETNMLEEEKNVLAEGGKAELVFRPFEIKTLKVIY